MQIIHGSPNSECEKRKIDSDLNSIVAQIEPVSIEFLFFNEHPKWRWQIFYFRIAAKKSLENHASGTQVE